MPDYAALATRYAGRPLLLTPTAARDLAVRIRNVDARAFQRPGRVEAFLRRVGLAGHAARQPQAMDDDDYGSSPPVPLEEQLAYTPRWLGEAEDLGFCWSLKDGVALMCCDTPLVARGDEFCGWVYHGYDTLLQALREADADARVKAIFLRLDTPGGVVDDGLRVLGEQMRSMREAAGGKPIWVYADMACSAGYWIAAQADRIIAPGVGYVGSIGAVMVHENWAAALAEDGIEITSIEFPDGGEKTDGAWWKALSESARTAWKADVAECGRLFLADVVAGRPAFTEEALIATRAGVFMGDHADPARSGLALGFVDAIGGEEETFLELVEHISASASRNSTDDVAPGSRAAAATPKEAPMATTAPKTTAPSRAMQARANANRNRPAAATEDEDTVEGAGASDSLDGDEGADTLEGAAESDTLEAGAGSDTIQGAAGEDDEDETAAIAASAEAKAQPHLALAAIQSKQTLAQFKANVAALGAAPRGSRLDSAMAGSRRLKPDAEQKKGAGFSGAMAARAQSNREKRG